jgi:hypothetical protein
MTCRWLLELSIAASVVATSPQAVADVTKAQCVDANTAAQSLRREGKFAEARAILAVCNDPQCPALVRDDCTRQLDALAEVQPTVVFDAKDASGADLSSVRVSIDGRTVVEKLDGAPVPVDRGEHHFTFETDGRSSVTITLVIKEGEKQRRVSVTVGAGSAADAGPTEGRERTQTPTSDAGITPTRPSSAQSTLGILAAGAGIVGVAVGAVFGAVAASNWTATKSDCAAGVACRSYSRATADYNATVTDGTVSTVGLVGGAALVALGVALWATAPSKSSDAAPRVGLGPAAVTVEGHFR